ncbi:MAG: ABC transporter ATP-binding protein [Clostridia bacterium]
MRSIASFLKPYRIQIVIALLLMLVELQVELWHPMLMAKIINEGITQKNLSVVLQWGGFMVALSLVGFAAGITNSFFAAHVSQNFGYDIRKSLFRKIQFLPFSVFNQFPTETLLTRMTSDVTQMQSVVFMGLRIMMRAPLLLIGGLVMALIVDFQLAFILAVVTPLLFIFIIWMMRKGFTLFRSVQDRLDRLNGIMRENLMGMRLIKVFVRDEYEIKRFTKSNEELTDRTTAALRLVELTVPVLLLLMNISILVILWFGRLEVASARVNVGDVVAIVNYATRITTAFSIVSMIIMSLSRAKASATRVSEVLNLEQDQSTDDNTASPGPIADGKIVFDHVSFQYPGTRSAVLDSVSFTVEAGTTVAIMGATGSGKTSLFQLIPRLYEVTRGRILIDGIDSSTMRLEDLRNQIGYVPQEAHLFTGSVRENLLWGKKDASMEDITEAAKNAQIHETIMKFPDQYEMKLGQKGVNLSGGQKQRLSIARALIRKPKILLLDDSTSALDVQTEANLLAALKQYPCTTFLITQKISTAMKADRILILEEGKLVAEGDHASLLQCSALYRQIVASQSGGERARHV